MNLNRRSFIKASLWVVGAAIIAPKVLQDVLSMPSGDVGWKTYYACAILNEQWIARLEVAATA